MVVASQPYFSACQNILEKKIKKGEKWFHSYGNSKGLSTGQICKCVALSYEAFVYTQDLQYQVHYFTFVHSGLFQVKKQVAKSVDISLGPLLLIVVVIRSSLKQIQCIGLFQIQKRTPRQLIDISAREFGQMLYRTFISDLV